MKTIGSLLKSAGETFHELSGDKGFKKLEVLRVLARTTDSKEKPTEDVYAFLKGKLSKKGYAYACSIIDAHITGDKSIIIHAYLNPPIK